METGVYTVLHRHWIEAFTAQGTCGNVRITAVSSSVWAGAARLLERTTEVPLYIRASGGEDAPQVTHVARLVAVKFAREFPDGDARRAWLTAHLSVQRDWIRREWQAGRGERRQYRDWEVQFGEWAFSSAANSYFTFTDLRAVTPFPVSDLLQESDGEQVLPDACAAYLMVYRLPGGR